MLQLKKYFTSNIICIAKDLQWFQCKRNFQHIAHMFHIGCKQQQKNNISQFYSRCSCISVGFFAFVSMVNNEWNVPNSIIWNKIQKERDGKNGSDKLHFIVQAFCCKLPNKIQVWNRCNAKIKYWVGRMTLRIIYKPFWRDWEREREREHTHWRWSRKLAMRVKKNVCS